MQPKSTPVKAAGVLLFRRAGETAWLLLRSAKHGTFGFPKGHSDPGETELETACRELYEETGLEGVTRLEGFRREISYEAVEKRAKVFKTVAYFLAELAPGLEPRKSDEHDLLAWEAPAEALRTLRFENLRSVLGAAVAAAWKHVGYKAPLPDTEAERWGAQGDRAGRADHLSRVRRILFSLGSESDKWVRHSLAVAAAGASIAAALHGRGQPVRPAFVEAAGLLHDLGRAVDHERHGFAGFDLLEGLGLPEMARISGVHWLKGRTPRDLEAEGFEGGPEDLRRARRWAEKPLSLEEEALVLADSAVAGDGLVGVEKRCEAAKKRYGDTPWTRKNRELSLRLQEKLEALAGVPLARAG